MNLKKSAIVISLTVFSFPSFSKGEVNTYSDLQEQRGLSLSEQKKLSEKEKMLNDITMDTKILKAQEEYNKLKESTENVKKQLIQTPTGRAAPLDKRAGQLPRNNQNGAPNPTANLQNNPSEFQLKQVQKWMDEMSSQIFLVDITEIAGKRVGDFWINGGMMTRSEGQSLGNWTLKTLDFDQATLTEIKPESAKKGRQTITVLRKTKEEALYISNKIDAYKQAILDQRLQMAGSLTSGTLASPLLINNSPTPGQMFE